MSIPANPPLKWSDADIRAAVAAHRFGYGARPGELADIKRDAQGWLIEQIRGRADDPELKALPGARDGAAALIRAERQGPQAFAAVERDGFARLQQERAAHLALMVNTTTPFRERLVRFWTEQFGINARDPRMGSLAAAFEREVIRPNMTGPLYTLMMQAIRHPAFLLHLRNENSMGPRSPAAWRGQPPRPNRLIADRLVNAYTLGRAERRVDGLDIASLAEMFTGWTVDLDADPPRFRFQADWHTRGPKRFFGQVIPDGGVLQGEAAVEILTRHRSTARRLAYKLARHFVADDPPQTVVDAAYNGFAASGFTLGGMAEGMVTAADSWFSIDWAANLFEKAARDPSPMKVKSPTDLVVSAARALDERPTDGTQLLAMVEAMGERPFAPPTEEGWPDVAGYWIDPRRMSERLEWAETMGAHAEGIADPVAWALDVMGARFAEETRRRMLVAPNPQEAMSILFASPEFQRR